jgi:type II secretory pathway component PulF
MMKAGVPLVQGFEIVAEGLENPAMREVVLGIKGEVEGGNTFAALKNILNILITYFVHLLNLVNNQVRLKPCWIVSQFIKKKVNC